MEQLVSARKVLILWALVLLAVLYCTLQLILGSLTGQRLIDGSLGIVLGLFICSQPAANAIDLLFMERGLRYKFTTGWPAAQWISLNLLAMLAGWFAIFLGATRFANRGG